MIKKSYRNQRDERLIIREKAKLHQITVADIASIYSESGITTVKKINNEKFVFAKNMSSFEKQLSELDFIRANRNEMVNCAHILSFDAKQKQIELCNEVKIKISRRNIGKLQEKLFKEKSK